jgi:TonB family protein
MMSEYETSKTIYERIINQYPETDAGILSWKLLDFLTGMEKRREQVAAQRLSEFDRAKQYYLLMDYRNSIKHFSQFFQSNPRSSRASEARYFKGRAHEELGEIEEATMEYNRVIRNKRAGKWAREANRRMLMLGEFYEQKQQMAQEARKRLEAYQDNFFMNRIEQLSEMVSENSLRAELLQESSRKPGAKAMADEEIMSLINSIGELDLTGEKEQEERRKELERELIERGNLSKAEVQELKRRRMLNDNPYRRPRALKRVIDGNAGQLRYIYNKRLRRGIKLSGKMIVEMKIQPNGRVEGIEVINSNIGDSSFEKDITEQIEKWRFKPVDESLGEMTLRYPFEFYEEE